MSRKNNGNRKNMIRNAEMEAAQRNAVNSDVIKQLMEILEKQNMKEQSKDFAEVLQYVSGMQEQLGAMAGELQDVREKLAEIKDRQPKGLKENMMEKTEQLEGKVSNLAAKFSALKENLLETAAKAIQAFKENGQQEMNKVLKKGIHAIKGVVMEYRDQLMQTLDSYEKTARQIDSIGGEIKKIGNSLANVGRLIAGKEAKEPSQENQGIGITRLLNTAIKSQISTLQNAVEKTEKIAGKLDKVSSDVGSKVNRSCIKEKLTQMKEKAEKQKIQPMEKEGCLER